MVKNKNISWVASHAERNTKTYTWRCIVECNTIHNVNKVIAYQEALLLINESSNTYSLILQRRCDSLELSLLDFKKRQL